MRKYCLLQAKRLLRVLPGVILAALILLGSLLAVFTMVIRQDNSGAVRSPRLFIDYAGERDHGLLELSDTLPAELYDVCP